MPESHPDCTFCNRTIKGAMDWPKQARMAKGSLPLGMLANISSVSSVFKKADFATVVIQEDIRLRAARGALVAYGPQDIFFNFAMANHPHHSQLSSR